MGKSSVKLRVLICTFGKDGIWRIATANHPQVEGVEYVVTWQKSDGCDIPDELLRDDFHIIRTDTIGLSKNRNVALSVATAPLAVIADDDLSYTAENLKNVIAEFDNRPEVDIITFRYECEQYPPSYPAPEFSLNRAPKGYHPVSFEIGFRTEKIVGNHHFNEWFGIGSLFPSGEEEIFLYDLISAGLKGIHLDSVLARHDGPTTAERDKNRRSFIVTKGAVFSRLFPLTWWLRMLTHAYRFSPSSLRGMIRYCKKWMAGVKLAQRYKVFH